MRIISFSPYLGIWQHSLPESLFLDALKEKHEIFHLQCNGLFAQHCVTMSSYGIEINSSEKEKNKVCTECKKNKAVLNAVFDFKKLLIEDFIDSEKKIVIEETIKNITKENYMDFYLDNIPIGKYAYYIVSLNYKKNSYLMTDIEFKEYLVNLRNSLFSYYLAIEVIKEIKPQGAVIYNTHYPTNRVFADVLINHGIVPYYLHAGPNIHQRLNSLYIGKNHYYQMQRNQFHHWQKIKNKQTNPETFKFVHEHYSELITAQNPFVYSSSINNNKSNLREYYKIDESKKVVLLTMSSFDERFASETIGILNKETDLIFESQNAWLQHVTDFFSRNKDLFLIIRVHPREFPNKREGVLSENGIMLRKILSSLPENVVVNWPEEKISLYNLVSIIDLCLNFTSSVGKELIFFGVPVLTYVRNSQSYPIEINYYSNNKNEYFNFVKNLPYEDFNIQKIQNLFRWYSIDFFYSVMYFDPMQTLSEKKLSIHQRIKRKFMSFFFDRYEYIKDAKKKLNIENKKLIIKYAESNFETLIDLYDFNDEGKESMHELKNIRTTVESISREIGLIDMNCHNRTKKLLLLLEREA